MSNTHGVFSLAALFSPWIYESSALSVWNKKTKFECFSVCSWWICGCFWNKIFSPFANKGTHDTQGYTCLVLMMWSTRVYARMARSVMFSRSLYFNSFYNKESYTTEPFLLRLFARSNFLFITVTKDRQRILLHDNRTTGCQQEATADNCHRQQKKFSGCVGEGAVATNQAETRCNSPGLSTINTDHIF